MIIRFNVDFPRFNAYSSAALSLRRLPPVNIGTELHSLPNGLTSKPLLLLDDPTDFTTLAGLLREYSPGTTLDECRSYGMYYGLLPSIELGTEVLCPEVRPSPGSRKLPHRFWEIISEEVFRGSL